MTARSIRDEARRETGEPLPSLRLIVKDAGRVESEIAALEGLSRHDLLILWRRLFRVEPPSRSSRDLLVREIADRMQERVFGGLAASVKRRLRAVMTEIESKGADAFEPSASLRPGARLVREWGGRTHTVTALDDGFDYAGERFRSLTKIATRITGAHWSGPRFFGINRASRVRTPAEIGDV